MWDVFISHASEDKEKIARPLAEELRKRGLSVWYDEFTIKIGHSLRQTIDQGLKGSKYGIVILSKNFFAKDWPQKELDGLTARERNGKKIILPIWHNITKEEIAEYSPTLAGLYAAKTKDGIPKIIDMIMEVLEESPQESIITEQPSRDKNVTIIVEKESFLIGSSIFFSGYSENCGDHVHLIVSGPGEFSKGKEIAIPPVSQSNKWEYQWFPPHTIIPGKYIISAFDSEKKRSKELVVEAKKGQISITVQGSGSYCIGDKIKFDGTCTCGNKVYLLLKGPNASQEERKLDQLTILSKNGDTNTFVDVDVRRNCVWSYVWDTAAVATLLKEGYYRIYAIEAPFTPDNLSGKAFHTVSIDIRKPFTSAEIVRTTNIKGEKIVITGIAEGVQNQEILIWIFGNSYSYLDKTYTNLDTSYSYEIPPIITKKLDEGQYFVIIQTPNINNEFDIYFDDKKNVLSNISKKREVLFSLQKEGGHQGFDAVRLLLAALSRPDVENTYGKLSFCIESPVILFDPIGDKKVGNKLIITAKTNLSVGNQIYIEIFLATTTPNQITKVTPNIIPSRIVDVKQSDAEFNKIEFELNATSLKPAEYIVKASAMDVDINASAKFNVIEDRDSSRDLKSTLQKYLR